MIKIAILLLATTVLITSLSWNKFDKIYSDCIND